MNKLLNYILIPVTTALLGELYFYPFEGEEFRFTIGVIAFCLAIIFYDDVNEIVLSLLTSAAILLFRPLIDFFMTGADLTQFIAEALPSSMYYFLYGLLVVLLKVKKNRENPYIIVMQIFCIDVFCNLAEALMRQDLNASLFKYILLIGIIRSIISYCIFILIRNQNNIIRKKEHQKRYMQLNALVSNIQAELFYLKKSAADIENVMEKSYSLYEKNKYNTDLSNDALNIARNVHEIKKDYYRVLDGFENFLKDFDKNDSMSFKDIAFIIEGNSKRYIEENNKHIYLSFVVTDDVNIKNYYSIFTVLNNLIVNSADAISTKGNITIVQKIKDDNLILSVTDDGKGIDKSVISYIFNPGFTTKYDKVTGRLSTGIGLSHVKNIIDEMNGSINIDSVPGHTEFLIKLPLTSL